MINRSLALAALLSGTCLTFPAFAQAAPAVPPPQRYQIDGNGVDHATGAALIPQTELSIGPNGPGGLSVMQWFSSGGIEGIDGSVGGGPTNWHLILQTDSSGNYYAGLGMTSDAFSRSGSTFTSLAGNGSTLTLSGSTYTYGNAAGVKIVYDYTTTETGETNVVARASKITYPTGETNALYWATITYCTTTNDNCDGGVYRTRVRLQSVTSSDGYQLHFNYGSDNAILPARQPLWVAITSIQAINLGLDYCDPSAFSCTTPNQTPPAVSYLTSYPTGNGATMKVTDPLGRVTQYHSDIGTFQIQKPTASSYDITYTTSAALVSQVVRDGMTYGYADTLAGSVRTITVTDPLSHTTTTTADTNINQILTAKDGLNHTTTYTYDTGGNLKSATLPEGNKVVYTLDGRGNATTTTYSAKAGSGLADIVTSAVYPTSCTNLITCNKPTSVTDADGNTTSYTYDPTHGGVLSVTGAAVGGIHPQTRYTYATRQAYYRNSAGSIVASGVATYRLTNVSACRTTASCTGMFDETKSTITYGSTGVANNLLPTSVASGAGDGSLTATTSATYDAQGNPLTRTDPLGHVTRYRYDPDREPTGVVGPDPDGSGTLKNRATQISYNADGQVTLVAVGTSAADGTAFTYLQHAYSYYDAADRKVLSTQQAYVNSSDTDHIYSLTQYNYDAAGRLNCTAMRMNPSTYPSQPDACTLEATGTYGPDRISKNTYDNADRLLKVTTGYGVTTANGYPATLQRDEETVTWSNNGRQLTLADARNNLTTYVHDGFDRLSKTEYPSPTTAGTSNTADYEQPGYDANGNVTSLRRRDGGTFTFAFDALNRLTARTPSTSEPSASFTYDLLGEMTQANNSDNVYENFTWDALGRRTSQTARYGGTNTSLYDLAGRRTRLTWSDGFYVTYDYDTADEMTGIHENGGTTVLASFGYDDLGRRKTRTLANGTGTTYGFDPISRLTSLALAGGTSTNTATLAGYSPAGEIGSRANSNDAFAWTQGTSAASAYARNGLNQYTTVAGTAQTYDTRGNMTNPAGVGVAYDLGNHLTLFPNSYIYYNALGQMTDISIEQTRFGHDGDAMIVERNYPDTAILRRYVFGPGTDEPIVWYEGSGTTDKRYMDQDERGSITRITKQDGSTLAVDSYDEYGNPASTNQGRFQYTGQAWIPELGMYYYKARMYSPQIGRFVQTDPIGYGDGPNWYNYVGSDPINLLDPLGLTPAATEEIVVTAHRIKPYDLLISIPASVLVAAVAAATNGVNGGPAAPPAPTDKGCSGPFANLASSTYKNGEKASTVGTAVGVVGALTGFEPGAVAGALVASIGSGMQTAAGVYYFAHGNPTPFLNSLFGKAIDNLAQVVPNDPLGFRDSTAATADIANDALNDTPPKEDKHACKP